METALAAPTDTKPRLNGFGNLPAKHILMLLAGIAALAAIAVASINWARTPDYKVLFANLSDRDGGSVMASLSQMNVPYRFAEGGGAILVPASMVHEARLKLASQGLPKGGTVGFELMETQRFGVTQFQERLNFQRGLEGELSRSIQALAAVQNARVHLALPAQNGFMREQQKPSASVLLALHPGRTLDRAQVAGIVHLVAASVPELSPKEVSVIDQTGALLSQNGESQSVGLDPGQLNYIRQIESGYIQRITDILEPILGREQRARPGHGRRRFHPDRVDGRAVQAEPGRRARRDPQPATVRVHRPQRRARPDRDPGRDDESAPGRRHGAGERPGTGDAGRRATGCGGRGGCRGRVVAQGRGDELRGRQDGARDADGIRPGQATDRGGGREPSQDGGAGRQGHLDTARAGRDREHQRSGARGDRLREGARRLDQRRQRAVLARGRGKRARAAAVEATPRDRHREGRRHAGWACC